MSAMKCAGFVCLVLVGAAILYPVFAKPRLRSGPYQRQRLPHELQCATLTREGVAAMATGNLQEAEQKLRKALTIRPQERHTRLVLLDVLVKRHRTAEAVAEYRYWLFTPPPRFSTSRTTNIDWLLSCVDVAHQAGDAPLAKYAAKQAFDSANREPRLLLAPVPDDGHWETHLATAYVASRSLTNGLGPLEEAYVKARQLAPTNPYIRLSAARLEFFKQDGPGLKAQLLWLKAHAVSDPAWQAGYEELKDWAIQQRLVRESELN